MSRRIKMDLCIHISTAVLAGDNSFEKKILIKQATKFNFAVKKPFTAFFARKLSLLVMVEEQASN